MMSKRLQLNVVGALVIVTTLANFIRSTLYLSGIVSIPQQHAAVLPSEFVTTTAKQSIISSSTTNVKKQNKNKQKQKAFVTRDDLIYQKDLTDFDTSPVVIEKYKLVFFTLPKVACTTWKFLFRRMMGYGDWQNQDVRYYMPHHPNYNGLKYLYNYTLEEATHIMTSDEWTRAIFVRDPKRRFLSAFLDKVYNSNGKHVRGRCCPKTLTCVPYDAEGFLHLIESCHDSHWDPQYYRLPPKFWDYINFVGHFENLQTDAKRLLTKIGAWEDYGKQGWGNPNNNNTTTTTTTGKESSLAIFEQGSTSTQTHITNSHNRIWQWYHPALERKVEAFYAMDYANPVFNLTMNKLTKDFYIHAKDKLWAKGDWDGAPIVVEKYKLIFFTIPKIGATQWKMLFRRMQGFQDWNVSGGDDILPHNPHKNGLTYLNDYDIEVASKMLQGTDYTKAIFVRNPKDRFLSVYNDLRYKTGQIENQCCPHERGCSNQMSTLIRFLDLMQDCSSAHWDPQYNRIEPRYWKHMDFIGHLENAQDDAKKLLQRIGAWEDHGQHGWGPHGNASMFAPTGHEGDNVRLALAVSYTPVVDRLVEKAYEADYNHPDLFHFPKTMWALTQK